MQMLWTSAVLGCCAVLGFTDPAYAQDQRARFPISEETREARRTGDLKSAVQFVNADLRACMDAQSSIAECLDVLRYSSEILRDRYDFEAGEAVARVAVQISEQFTAADDPDRAKSYHALAKFLSTLNRHEEAEQFFTQALDLRVSTLGEAHMLTGDTYLNLAMLYQQTGRLTEAETAFRSAVDSHREALGDDAPATGFALLGLTNLLQQMGRYRDAEQTGLSALAVLQRSRAAEGVPSNEAALTEAAALANLANTFDSLGRYDEAEEFARAALEMRRATVGDENHYTAHSYLQVAQILTRQQRRADAEVMAAEALRLARAFHGPRLIEVAPFLEAHATILAGRGKTEEALALLDELEGVYRAVRGNTHPDIARVQSSRGDIHIARGELDAARTSHEGALQTAEAVYGTTGVGTAPHRMNIAAMDFDAGRLAEAIGGFELAVASYETVLPEMHPRLIEARGVLGVNLLLQNSSDPRALELLRQSSANAVQRTRRAGIDPAELAEFRRYQPVHAALVTGEWLGSQAGSLAGPTENAFQAAQWAMSNDAAATLSKVAASFARADDPVSRLEGERSDLQNRRDASEARYIALFADETRRQQRDEAAATRDRLDARIRELDAQIETADPAFADLTRPNALSVAATQALLAPDEAMLLTLTGADATYAFLVTDSSIDWTRSESLNAEHVRDEVDALRGAMINDLVDGSFSFSQSRAHRLYSELVAPFEQQLAGKRVLITASNDPLASLPFSLLVTREAEVADRYMDAEFLVDRLAVVSLPSVSSLNALRCLLVAREDAAAGCGVLRSNRQRHPAPSLDFVGIGAPRLASVPGEVEVPDGSPYFALAFDGTLADTEFLRSLDSLPGAQRELELVSALFDGTQAMVRQGEAATETAVKTMAALSTARFVLFSTHGLLASESGVAGQPGLVFTPPAATGRSAMDDGLLTASEAAQLSLVADLVVLSACNTATVDGNANSEGLSSLARAFMFAGARSLLVSHWIVSDAATSQLMTTLFQAELDGSGDRADALRSAMLAIKSTPEYDNPAYWAAFALIGTPN